MSDSSLDHSKELDDQGLGSSACKLLCVVLTRVPVQGALRCQIEALGPKNFILL